MGRGEGNVANSMLAKEGGRYLWRSNEFTLSVPRLQAIHSYERRRMEEMNGDKGAFDRKDGGKPG